MKLCLLSSLSLSCPPSFHESAGLRDQFRLARFRHALRSASLENQGTESKTTGEIRVCRGYHRTAQPCSSAPCIRHPPPPFKANHRGLRGYADTWRRGQLKAAAHNNTDLPAPVCWGQIMFSSVPFPPMVQKDILSPS